MAGEWPQENSNSSSQPSDRGWSARVFAQKILIAFGIVVAFALALAILWAGAEVFLLGFAGMLVAIFLRTLGGFLSKHTPVSETSALVIVILTAAALSVLAVWLLAPSVQQQFEELTEQLPVVYENAKKQIAQYPLGNRIVEQIPAPEQFILGRQPASVLGRVTGFFSTALDIVTSLLIVLVFAIYFAFNPSLYTEGVVKLVPQDKERRAREILGTIEITLRRFLIGMSASMLIGGTLTFLGLWLLGVPFAVPLGIIAGLLNFIPNIGPFIAGLPAVLIALSQSPAQALYVVLLYAAVQNLEGFVVTPLIQQRAVALPPVLVISSQILFAVIFGFLGLLLAVPIFAVLFVLVKMIYVEDILGRRIEVKGEPQAKNEVSREEAVNSG